MICTRCLPRRAATNAALLTLPARPHPLSSLFLAQRSSRSSRSLSSSSSPLRQNTTEKSPSTPPTPSPPFSTPFTAPSSDLASSANDPTADTTSPQRSSRSKTPAGLPLRGLGYIKNQEPPKAWADHEYPEWLWGLLKSKNEDGGGEGSGKGFGDAFSKSKKQRRLAAKAALRAERERPSEPQIPLQHQSIDLAFGGGTGEEEAAGRHARDELKKTMRQERRKAIKERNFLSGV